MADAAGDAWGATPAADTSTSDAWGTAAPVANGDDWGAGGDATEDTGAADEAAEAKKNMSKDEFLKKAREAGWTEATAFDYEEFQRTSGDQTDYHGAAKVYEWKEEFGDVGPEVPELEKVLFGGEFQMRRGEHVEHLDLEVDLQGPVRVAPIRRVC